MEGLAKAMHEAASPITRKRIFFRLFRLDVVRETYLVVERRPSFAEATEGNFLGRFAA